MDKRLKENSKASAFGGFKKLLGWAVWAIAKVASWIQVELTGIDGSISKAESVRQVYRDTKDSKLSEVNTEMRKLERLVEKAAPRQAKALEEAKHSKFERYSELLEEYEAKLVQLDRVKRALIKA